MTDFSLRCIPSRCRFFALGYEAVSLGQDSKSSFKGSRYQDVNAREEEVAA